MTEHHESRNNPIDEPAVAEPFRWVSPREIIEGPGDDPRGGVREPRRPRPQPPSHELFDGRLADVESELGF